MSKGIKILLAEDEPALGTIIKENLESRDFEVFWTQNGEEALQAFDKDGADILILDVMMPKKDGFHVAEDIRKQNKNIPILFLTAKSQTKDVVKGFKSGGNDYLKKPFSMEELIVRIEELVSRGEKVSDSEIFQIGSYTFDFKKQTLTQKGKEETLTFRESEVLKMLVLNPNELIDKSTMLNSIWGNDDFYNARSLDVFITKLRKKISEDESIKIVNVRGYGYKIIC